VGLADLLSEAARLAELGVPRNTKAAYRSTGKIWREWCARHEGVTPLPASQDAVIAFLTEEGRRYKVSTLRRHLAALAVLHRAGGYDDPTKGPGVRAVLKGLEAEHGTATRQADALTVPQLLVLVDDLGRRGLGGVRDTALILVGVAGGLRVAELAALQISDVVERDQGAELTVRRSKTDQIGAGAVKLLFPATRRPLCPLAALAKWRGEGMEPDATGALFRSVDMYGNVGASMGPLAMSRAVSRAARRAGLTGRITGHSLRATFVTLGYAHGIPEAVLQAQSGHRSSDTLRGYRRGLRWEDRAALRGLL
jgi:integrase